MKLASRQLEALRAQLSGELILADHSHYDLSREIWNRRYDRRPAVIVQCTTAADVIAAIRFAREHDVEIAIKGGGHHHQ
jgi:FAD/FMN-containing dehydrogenase